MKRRTLMTPIVVVSMGVAAAAAACAGYGGGGSGSSGGAPGGSTYSGSGGTTNSGSSSGTSTGSGSGSPTTASNGDAGSPVSVPTTPPTTPTPPVSATYVRGSLIPPFQFIPRSLYGNNAPPVNGQFVAMQDSDLETTQVSTSIAQKESDVSALITSDNNATTPVNIISNSDDQQRAALMPFRGKPSDVKFVTSGATTQLFVPLGGDVMSVGDEVSVLTVANNVITPTQTIQVGVRPQRLAVHPSGLVFVCNQYSNYISIINPQTDALLLNGSKPVEIPTEYYCADMAFVPAPDNNPDHQYLYVANRWRHSVLKYEAFVVRDSNNNVVNVVQPDNTNPSPANAPLTEILGVGGNPWRLNLSDQEDAIFVANNKGGEVARIELDTDTVSVRVGINAPSADVLNINNILLVPTTMPARGLVDNQIQQVPAQLAGSPVLVTGLDNQQHVANVGAIFDNTESYNFEDTRDGLQQLDFLLNASSPNAFYYTDNNTSEPNFQSNQKILQGSQGVDIERNSAGTLAWMADQGSDIIEEFNVNVGVSPNAVTPSGRTFKTQGHRPFAITVDEANNRLFVADWGSEIVEQISLSSGKSVASADTGFAQPPYPATNVESGEFNFYNAAWSNNARKACSTCHYDELDSDGIGYSQGAIAPTNLAEVKPNHNIFATGGYFWNASFNNGNYTTLAFAFQTRDNCQVVEFGFDEGVGSNPATRIGDPNNLFGGAFAGQDDTLCRPIDGTPGSAANAAQIDAVDKAEQAFANTQIQKITGFQFEELARVIGAYDGYALRLPPNPLAQEYAASQGSAPVQLDSQTMSDMAAGQALFNGAAGCAGCHLPNDPDHPFTDNLNHGSDVTWIQDFVNTYQDDPRITSTIGSFPQTMLQSIPPTLNNDHEVNMWTKLDYFIFACFDLNNCLEFDDPLQVRGDTTEETRRLNLLLTVNLENPDRQFIPGDVVGEAYVNTPSLRGVWSSANFLHHGLAHSIREAILAPGHPALQAGENGFAIDQYGKLDVHGITQTLTVAQVQSLVTYVNSIE